MVNKIPRKRGQPLGKPVIHSGTVAEPPLINQVIHTSLDMAFVKAWIRLGQEHHKARRAPLAYMRYGPHLSDAGQLVTYAYLLGAAGTDTQRALALVSLHVRG